MLTGLTVLFECCILAFLQSIGVQSRPVVLIMPMIFLVSLAYFFEVGRSWRLKPVAFQLAIAYCMRVFLVLLDIYGRSYVSLPNSGADSEMFYSQAIRYSLGDKGYGAFTDITGMVFSWIGVSRLYMQFLLMLCSILALHTLVRIMQQTDVEAVVQSRVMWVLCLIPNFAILSSVFLRESIVVLLVTLSLYFFVGWWNYHSEWRFALAFVVAFCGARFHSGVTAIAAGYILIRLLYDKRNQMFRLSLVNTLQALIFLFVFAYLYINHGDVLFFKMMRVETLEDISSNSVSGGSSYAAYVGNSDTLLNMVIFTPLRMAFFLFSPFPWHWRGVSDVIAFCLNSIFYIGVWYSVLKEIRNRRGKKCNLLIAIAIIAFVTAFVFGWGVSNTGTAIRHRDKMVILYGIMFALTERSDRRDYRVRVGGKRWN